MKKFIYTAISLLLLANGCQKSDGIEESVAGTGKNVLNATLHGDTRTMLGDLNSGQYENLWSEGDRIGVFINGEDRVVTYDLIDGAGSSSARFAGEGSGSSYVAVYPASSAAGLNGNSVSLVLPAEQNYAESSFGPDSFPMVAVSETADLAFRNLGAVLKLSIRGNATVQSIRFTPNDESTAVAGNAVADITDPKSPQMTISREGLHEVVLDCGEGCTLDSEKATDFYIVLPPQIYTGGFTVLVCSPDGNMQKRTSQDIELHRSEIFSMQAFEFKVNVAIEASKGLHGEGSAAKPFEVGSIGDLMLFRNAVNSENGKITSLDSGAEVAAQTARYRLTADIDMTGYNNSFGTWTPIGDYMTTGTSFRGTFDGNNHSINNIHIESSTGYAGFFGYCSGATIKDLTLSGKFTTDTQNYSGILSGRIFNGTISNCKTYGSLTTESHFVGGIAGSVSYTKISDCSNYADVTGYSSSGGIIGVCSQSTLIYNCANYGSVTSPNYPSVGGVVGSSTDSNIYNSCNYGVIQSSSSVGGIVGLLNPSSSNSFIANCSNAGEVLGWKEAIGGIIGKNDTGNTVVNCINTGRLGSSISYLTAPLGGICGVNAATVRNCYWLSAQGVAGGIETNQTGSTAEFVIELTEEQMKGTVSTGLELYTSPVDGSFYTSLLDALNAWAADNTAPAGFYFGWKKGNPYPEFTFTEAVRPDGSNESVFHSFVVRHTNTTFAAPLVSGPYTGTTINWGDGKSENYDKSLVHTYTSGGEHAVEVSGESILSFELPSIKGVTKLELN